jgi:hypothetical protein
MMRSIRYAALCALAFLVGWAASAVLVIAWAGREVTRSMRPLR